MIGVGYLFQEELAEGLQRCDSYSCHRVKERRKLSVCRHWIRSSDIGIVELVWKNEKIAVILPSQEPCKETLTTEGWKVFMYDDEALLNALKEG
jgi:hypothetical protein